MSYDNADIVVYGSWGNEAFGASTILHYIVGPPGKVGFVRDIEVDLTVATVGTTVVPEIDVGIASGDFTYGRYRLGTSATVGYAIGPHKASNEWAIVGNPPRNAQDYAGHVQLDGYPLFSSGIAGGSFGTVVPQGRIAASKRGIINVTSGNGGNARFWTAGVLDPQIVVGQLVNVYGVQGATMGGAAFLEITAISALSSSAANPANPNWFECAAAFGGAYTGGGYADIVTVVTEKTGTGTPAGTGHVRVKIEWIGAQTP